MSSTVLATLAHPGHGTTDPSSWTHYLTEPVHVATLVAAVVVIVALVWAIVRGERSTTE